MKRYAAYGAVGALLLCVTGCGGPDALMREFVANLNVYAETLEKREPKEKQQAALDRIKATTEKLDRLKLSKEDQDKLFTRYDAELKRVKERVEAAQKAVAMEGADADTPDLFSTFKPK
ncbi:hypothetical protein R5W23_000375 [Gemmata sp. JC673]|uniref:OmpH family outer membrane protein n=1 Tax=Gemmata algarum TaxID=2975278 RepID=A0ABU5EVR3_9BACT|nr:hypothetical protein [Gemmata algarum]MDY3559383.1 hypothetical protein [Gemmata algarum]